MVKREGLPVTNPARTIIDVTASGLSVEHINLAVHLAIRQGLGGKDELLNLASRRGGRVQRIIEKILAAEA